LKIKFDNNYKDSYENFLHAWDTKITKHEDLEGKSLDKEIKGCGLDRPWNTTMI
jgi:hypothetical protein